MIASRLPERQAPLLAMTPALLTVDSALLAVISALLGWAAFPPLGWHYLAWVGMAPLAFALRFGNLTPGGGFLLGWLYGLVYHGLQLMWLHRVLVEISGVGWAPYLLFTLLSVGFLALLPAIITLASHRLWSAMGFSPLLSLPLGWLLLDALLGVFPFNGFVWGALGGSQPHTLAAGWVAPLAGGAGLAGLMVGVGALWAGFAGNLLIPSLGRQPQPAAALGSPDNMPLPWPLWWLKLWPHRWLKLWAHWWLKRWPQWRAWRVWTALGLLILITGVLGWPRSPGAPIPALLTGTGPSNPAVLLVPGNLSMPTMHPKAPNTFRYYFDRTLKAQNAVGLPSGTAGRASQASQNSRSMPKIGLSIWPESSVNKGVWRGKQLVTLSNLANLTDSDILLGSDTLENGREFNSAYLVPVGRFDFYRYDKRLLVPFGEYVPSGFRWAFPSKLTTGSLDYSPGVAQPILPWRGGKLGVAICFESILPDTMLRATRQGARFIVVLANEEWLTPAAREHHRLLTALRGLEIGRDVLFVSNGGFTGLLRDGLVQTQSPLGPRGNREPVLVQPYPGEKTTPWALAGHWMLAPFALGLLFLGWTTGRLFRWASKKQHG